MGFIVAGAGMRTLVAETGNQALEICKAQQVDLMLLDVQLPDINGLEILAQVRRNHPDIGVIMVTVVKEPAVHNRAMALGAADFVVKDFDSLELAGHVARPEFQPPPAIKQPKTK
jgi:CheY-like chemotaxis protein